MTKAVQLQVAVDRFIGRVLPKLFEHPDRAISEALQNSRRAGATEIRVLIAEDPSDASRSVVTIADDGSGILDWSSLLTVARSAWASDLADREDAFGIGFAALLFSAREVVVRSRGHELALNQADAVAGKRFSVIETRAAPASGTLVRLGGFVLRRALAEAALRMFAEGFPLPVYLDKEELAAPHRPDESFVETPAGRIRFNRVGVVGTGYYEWVQAYYQGLPIRVPLQSQKPPVRPAIVIHVDEARHPAKAPDRTCLVDPDRFRDDYLPAVTAHWVEYLRDRHRESSPEDFVANYWDMALKFECVELLNACPVLPATVLRRVAGHPYLAEAVDVYASFARSVRRDEVESGAVVLGKAPDDLDDRASMAFLTLARNLGWAIVDELPESHWAAPYVVSIDEATAVDGASDKAWTVEVQWQPVQSAVFFGRQVEFDFDLTDQYAICLKDAAGRVVYSCEIGDRGVMFGGRMVVPARECGESLVRQASYYLDDNEIFLDNELEEDDHAFMDLIAEMRGRSPAETLHRLLNNTGAASKPGMAGSVCVVMIGDPDAEPAYHNTMRVIQLSPQSVDDLLHALSAEAGPLAGLATELAPLVERFSQKRAQE